MIECWPPRQTLKGASVLGRKSDLLTLNCEFRRCCPFHHQPRSCSISRNRALWHLSHPWERVSLDYSRSSYRTVSWTICLQRRTPFPLCPVEVRAFCGVWLVPWGLFHTSPLGSPFEKGECMSLNLEGKRNEESTYWCLSEVSRTLCSFACFCANNLNRVCLSDPPPPRDLDVGDIAKGRNKAICHPGVYILMQEAGQ